MRAFLVTEHDGILNLDVGDVEPRAVNESDLLVKVEYSGVNFKDVMVASAPSRVRRLASLVGGVDAAGTVVTSPSERFSPGDSVAVHGGSIGVARDGGFGEFIYAPDRYVSALPATISTRDAMIIGTAGFTAMASVLALTDRGLKEGACILVTGATGGVGSQALTYLSQRGYEVVASSGSTTESSWLVDRGAARVIGRDEVSDKPDRVLGSEIWDGAIDCIGGDTLHQILRSLRYGAAVAASGLVAGAELSTSMYPFITRSVALLGIDAVEATVHTRERVWQALAEAASTVDFNSFVDREIGLDGLREALDSVRAGATRGRILVALERS